MLTVVLFAVGSRLFGPAVQQLRGKHEYVEYAARVMDFIGIMSSDDSDSGSSEEPGGTSDTSTTKGAARRSGVSDPSAVPGDLPQHPRATETLYNVGPAHVLIYQRVAGSRDQVIGQLREQMRKQGWKQVSETPGDWSTLVRWTKGERSCMVEFADDSGVTEIWLRSIPPRSRQSTVPNPQ